MRLKQEHADGTISLESFDVAKDDVWHEETMEQSECGRWGHWEGMLYGPARDVAGNMVRDMDGEVIWVPFEYKGVCAKCGARRKHEA